MPEEPQTTDKNGTSIRFRMPDGNILQRRFFKNDKVQVLHFLKKKKKKKKKKG